MPTRSQSSQFGICDAKGRVVERYATRYFAGQSALTWAVCKRAAVTTRQGRKIIARAIPTADGSARLDEGHTPELAL
ncbi:hypothetical protein A0U94_06490 [Gluconobacter albidus]|uniref:hypothetical protein n=1 Tax=Gluconobacter albidus TaxID=318683 RepID=UPI00098AB704|nr:hypothetical protein [Gluconobacter albidus]AQS90672.1 hypothetical protein A0U94_06490 [Gluconobacter albidus]